MDAVRGRDDRSGELGAQSARASPLTSSARGSQRRRDRHQAASGDATATRLATSRTDSTLTESSRAAATLRCVRWLLLYLGALLIAVSAAKAAPAPCWKVLINDWYDGRIDRTYECRCYRDAIDHLPTDTLAYSSVREDFERAFGACVAGRVVRFARF